MDAEFGSGRTVVAIVQARLGSVRLPAKVLSPALGRPMLAHLLERLSRSATVDQIVVAIPATAANDGLATLASELQVACFRGEENDVLDRYFRAGDSAGASIVVRITGDCPLVDPDLVDRVVETLERSDLDYVRTDEQFPDGFDVEAFRMEALRRASEQATSEYDREHVTPFMRVDPANRVGAVSPAAELPDIRVTLDEPEDAAVIAGVLEVIGHNRFTLDDVAELSRIRPELFTANRSIRRNEGAGQHTGEKLWSRAKRVIPGGNMLLSKRPEMHLPEGWPAYFSKASGCRVWDLDGREYLDVGLMGVGTNILGYGHPKVDEAVRRVVDAGNLSTLNCPEEVELAEALVGLHPWADMARFTRSGGEACAVAVRIARAASGRSGVAFCGYHGWHDWYLSANLSEDSALDGHLLPGLEPTGVPRGLGGSAHPFVYNDLDGLERVLEMGDIGVIFMEVQRGTPPGLGFLEGVRSLAYRHGAVLVFDECTSGFRRDLGGLHLGYGVEPDLATFGKTLGNGYAVAAVIGRESVMQAAQRTFISSTFWTERIGPAAAVAALEAMREEDAPHRIDVIGLDVRSRWEQLAERTGLPIATGGLPALGNFGVPHLDPMAVKTFVTQELLAQGFLAGTALYASLAHEPQVLDSYFEHLELVFEAMAACDTTDELLRRLPHGVAQSGFQRLA
ncbi:MAG TPA: aminotransferase class III-fold pyridoxal phosphate-dependent enzyme [Microthrixaceae bacterium]|nr:aminotransferase class III-fold pyridoxal phosphate-dependent enzyme [Microthrixaceae bacterium]